jgi:CrcB protein
MILVLTLAAAAGTLARYAVGTLFTRYFQTTFPYATLTVNLTGGFILGAIYAALPPYSPSSQTAFMALGAFTTFSTFNLETMKFIQLGEHKRAVIYGIFSYAGGLMLATLGYLLIRYFYT